MSVTPYPPDTAGGPAPAPAGPLLQLNPAYPLVTAVSQSPPIYLVSDAALTRARSCRRPVCSRPAPLQVDDFLTPHECEQLIAAAAAHLSPAPVIGKGSGEVSSSRTSSTCYLAREDLPILCAKLTGLLNGKPQGHFELPQVGRCVWAGCCCCCCCYHYSAATTPLLLLLLPRSAYSANPTAAPLPPLPAALTPTISSPPSSDRYLPNQYYKQHFDAFDLGTEDGQRFAQNGGQRVATVLVYLNDVPAGGQTSFPRAGIAVSPRRGSAVVFFPASLDGELDQRALHAAEDAVSEKWVSQIWVRQADYNGLPSVRIPPIATEGPGPSPAAVHFGVATTTHAAAHAYGGGAAAAAAAAEAARIGL